MIDNRYFRDEPLLNGSGDMLGELQWKWLENEIKTTDAQINIITNGIQLLPAGFNFFRLKTHNELR